MSLSAEELQLLPETIRNMIPILGLANVLTVVEKLGGSTWQVAEGKTAEGRQKRVALAEIVGSEIEQILHQHYAGDSIYIARCKVLITRLRDSAIHHEFDQLINNNISARSAVAQLARTHKLSDRWVWNILKNMPLQSDQPDLFNHY